MHQPVGGPEVDLDAVVRTVCDDLRTIDPRIVLEADARGLRVRGTEVALRRSVENLLSNARRFAASRIRVRVAAREGLGVVTVEDDGPGLPNSDAWETVWDTGTRLHRESGRSGTGLGLSIVRESVERWGGRVAAQRSELGGARFEFVLPLR
jgi:signal transduction histidine kinase